MEILCVYCGVGTEFFKSLDFMLPSAEIDFLNIKFTVSWLKALKLKE
jgi:hypothetical protein